MEAFCHFYLNLSLGREQTFSSDSKHYGSKEILLSQHIIKMWLTNVVLRKGGLKKLICAVNLVCPVSHINVCLPSMIFVAFSATRAGSHKLTVEFC